MQFIIKQFLSRVTKEFLFSQTQKVQMKDFSAEIRATLDIAHFLNQAVLLMDLTETNLECVVELMLHKMLDSEEPQCTVSEAKSLLFTSDSGEPQSVDIGK
jgi:ABC-type Na+ transport system ATPase subunit NatA